MALVDGLKAWWKLEESSGRRYDAHVGALDLIEDGTVGSAPGKFGLGAEFDEGIESLYHAHHVDLSIASGESFTIAMWLKWDSAIATGTRNPIAKAQAAGTWEFQLQIRTNIDLCRWFVYDTTPGNRVSVSQALTSGQFYFFVCWFDASTNESGLSIDDSATTITANNAPAQDSGNDFVVGNLTTGASSAWPGVLDDVAFWKRALSASERSQLYNNGARRSYEDVLQQ